MAKAGNMHRDHTEEHKMESDHESDEKHREFKQEAAIVQTMNQPMIADNQRNLPVTAASIHFSLSSFLANQVERMQARAQKQISATPPDENNEVGATREQPSIPQNLDRTPPGNKIPTQSQQIFLEKCKSVCTTRSSIQHLPA
jgi:hypothetical protein